MIRQPWLLFVSMGCLLLGLVLLGERAIFLAGAAHTHGYVQDVRAEQGRCGGSGKRRRSYTCTKFTAVVSYYVNGAVLKTDLPAGTSRGAGRPVSEADVRVGADVQLVYDPAQPSRVYENSFLGVFAYPMLAFAAQMITLLGSFTEPKRSRW